MNENGSFLERCPGCGRLVLKGHHGQSECERLATVRSSMQVERHVATDVTDSLFKRYRMYNGTSTLEQDVPTCEAMTLCEEKATQDCILCKKPTCNGHVSFATEQHICHYCRLIDWVQTQKG